jgi:hypothetical protein
MNQTKYVISLLGNEERENKAAGILHKSTNLHCDLEYREGDPGDQSGSGQMVLSSFNISRLSQQ